MEKRSVGEGTHKVFAFLLLIITFVSPLLFHFHNYLQNPDHY